MKLDKNKLEALSILMRSSRGLDAFSFFRRLNLSFADFTKIINSLSEAALIEEAKDDFFQITDNGREYLIKQNAVAADKHWRKVPERMLGVKLEEGSLYIPSIRLLDKNTFNIDKNELD